MTTVIQNLGRLSPSALVIHERGQVNLTGLGGQ